eukprot:2899437-Pyramimonas_sp.AAC.1
MDFLSLHEGMVQVRHQVCYRPPCALPSVCTLPCWEPEAVVQVACPICHAPGHSTERHAAFAFVCCHAGNRICFFSLIPNALKAHTEGWIPPFRTPPEREGGSESGAHAHAGAGRGGPHAGHGLRARHRKDRPSAAARQADHALHRHLAA